MASPSVKYATSSRSLSASCRPEPLDRRGAGVGGHRRCCRVGPSRSGRRTLPPRRRGQPLVGGHRLLVRHPVLLRQPIGVVTLAPPRRMGVELKSAPHHLDLIGVLEPTQRRLETALAHCAPRTNHVGENLPSRCRKPACRLEYSSVIPVQSHRNNATRRLRTLPGPCPDQVRARWVEGAGGVAGRLSSECLACLRKPRSRR